MKKIIIPILIFIALVLGALIVVNLLPVTQDRAAESIQKLVSQQIGKKGVTQAIVMVDAPQKGVSQVFTAGTMDGEKTEPGQPFHIASVGKAFTAALIGVLVDEGYVSLDDKIAEYLSDETLENLFVFEGVDYMSQVTVGQLLSHTSGIADYFEDEAQGSDNMTELVLSQPDRLWTPMELVDFTRSYQSAVAAPGQAYHYSDTGYILLGLIIENVSGKSFDDMLHEKIFEPLHMDDSCLMFYSEPKNGIRPIADVWLDGVNIKDYNSLSIDWAGGGIVSTADDLAVFVRALNNYEIVSQKTLDEMYQFDYKFINGIHYGYGFMEYNFGEFFPTLKSLPKFTGHMGVLGTQMFYDKASDMVYISSFGSADFSPGSVQVMIKIISILEKIR